MLSLDGLDCLPEVPFVVTYESNEQQMHCSLAWTEYNTNVISESYVNLIPTSQGGTHVNGLRSGLTDALKNSVNLETYYRKISNLHLTMFGKKSPMYCLLKF